MNLDDLLNWIMEHNVFLIEVLFLLIGATVSFVLFRSVMSGKDEVESGSSLAEIEKTLRKVLDTTSIKALPTEAVKDTSGIKDSDASAATPAVPPPPPAASSAGAAPAMSAEQLAAHKTEVESLKQELQKRESSLKDLQKNLEEAKATATQGGPAAPAVDTKEMEDKIKELQAKLAEYEIIEDDIANLSTYKTENSKLKSELEALKTKLGSSRVEETGNTSDNVKQFAALVGAETPNTVPGGGPAPLGIEPTKPASAAPPAAAPVAPTPEAPSPTVVAEAPKPAPPPPAATPTPSVKSVDEALVGEPEVLIDPGAAEFNTGEIKIAGEAPAEEALGDLDTDKLLAETKDLPDTAPTSPAEEGDQGEKLINEFENFMKGS